jgi:UDP-N-acetylmuramyl pentapeptide phosphotransferase/UDP-N-acetylglucosamine-1-phosphate transferase
MDGINGITALYSFTILGALYLLNRQTALFDNDLLACLAIANGVFSWFNCRRKPRAFAGDVGSVSMAYSLFFLTVWSVFHTGNPVFLLLFTLYGIDTFNTIIERLRLGENIFQAHRRHLFQYLANEMRIPHLWVSALYMGLQALISLYVLWIWQMEAGKQWLMAALLIVPLELLYLLLKYRVLPRYVARRR